MSKQTGLTNFFKGQSASRTSNSTTTTPSTSSSTPTNASVQLPTKTKSEEVKRKRNADPYHESHKNPILKTHYNRIGLALYVCKGRKSDNTNRDFRGNSMAVRNHARMCFSNLRESHNKRIKIYAQSHKEENKEKNNTKAKKFRDKNMEEVYAARLRGNPSLKCTFLNCSAILHTPYELSQHVYNIHIRSRSDQIFSEFLALDKWKRDWQEYDGSDRNSDIQKATRKFISNKRKGSHWAYIVIFLPNTVIDVESAWHYLQNNCEDSTCIIPYYPGKGAPGNESSIQKFNVESFHFKRTESTIIDFIKKTGMHAFQLCTIQLCTKQDSLASSVKPRNRSFRWLEPTPQSQKLFDPTPPSSNSLTNGVNCPIGGNCPTMILTEQLIWG